jgi:hypothetical protein
MHAPANLFWRTSTAAGNQTVPNVIQMTPPMQLTQGGAGLTLNRSAELGDFVGRTLDRRASRYDVPSRVTDDGWKSSYYDN